MPQRRRAELTDRGEGNTRNRRLLILAVACMLVIAALVLWLAFRAAGPEL
jgi:hypothetical protein